MYVAGQIALCPATMTMLESGPSAQSRLALRHVERILAAMNDHGSLGDIMLAVCYVTRRRYIPFAQQEWMAALADTHEVSINQSINFIADKLHSYKSLHFFFKSRTVCIQ